MNRKILTSFLAISLLATNIFCFNNIKSNAISNSELFEETLIKNINGNVFNQCYDFIKDGNDYIAVINCEPTFMSSQNDALLVKLDSNFNILKSKSIQEAGNDLLYNIIKSKDGYIAVGQTSSNKIINPESVEENTTLKEEAWIMKLDKELNIIKQVTIGGTGIDEFKSIVEVDDGYIAIGETYSPSINGLNTNGDNDILLVKFDYDLNIMNKTVFGGSKTETFHQNVMPTKNGILFTFSAISSSVVGLTTTNIPNRVDSVIVEIDKDLNILNKKIFGGNDDDSIYSMIETDTGYTFIGNTNSTDIEGINNPNSYTNFVMELDKSFNNIKAKNISGSYLEGEKLIKSKDGYTVLGSGYDEELSLFGLYLLNFDNDFNLISEKFDSNENSIYIDFMLTENEYTLAGIDMDTFEAVIKKVRLLYKNGQSIDLQVVADNSLEMSLSTNQISFKGYNGIADLTNNDLNITVTSGLYYDLFATLNDELRGSNDTQATIDKINLGIKTLEDLDYKNFTNIGQKLKLVENHVNGRNINHNINLKLKGDSSVKADTYSTSITFETIQK